MDNLTHTLIGVAVSKALVEKRVGRGSTLILAIASNLPDLDALWGFFSDQPSFMYRRMITHSIVGVPLLALAATMVFQRMYRHLSFKTIFGLTLAGMALHVFFDLLNSYGVVLLYPFSRTRFELGWVFIIDLALWFFLLTPLALSLFKKPWADLNHLYEVSLRCVMMYVLVCGGARFLSDRAVKRWLENENIQAQSVRVFPEPFGPQRFRVAAQMPEQSWSGLIRVWDGRIAPVIEVPNAIHNAQVQLIRQSPMGQTIEWFFASPVWTEGSEPNAWDVADLRFQPLLLKRGTPFTYRFKIDGGKVLFEGSV